MARDRRPQPPGHEADQSASAPASFVSAWLIALGLIAGLLFGLALSWALGAAARAQHRAASAARLTIFIITWWRSRWNINTAGIPTLLCES